MLRETLGLMRELPRLHEISSVFIRHGLGEFVRRIGVAGALERAGRILHWKAASASAGLDPASRVRMAFEELGPTFVKLGQVLATRVSVNHLQLGTGRCRHVGLLASARKLLHQPFEQL